MSGAGWWYRASQKQKLAQIDGGIECGLSARALAIVCRVKLSTLHDFAHYHGRQFPVRSKGAVGILANAKRAYWGAEHGYLNPHLAKPAALDPEALPELIFE